MKVGSCSLKSFVNVKRTVVKRKRGIRTLEERTFLKGNDGDCLRKRKAFSLVGNDDHWMKEVDPTNWRSVKVNQRSQTSTWLRNQNS